MSSAVARRYLLLGHLSESDSYKIECEGSLAEVVEARELALESWGRKMLIVELLHVLEAYRQVAHL